MATVAFVSTFTPILDNSGNVLVAGKLYFYEVGTTTAKNTYSDSSLTTANANPVVLSSAGIATVFLNGNYDLVIKTSADATVRSLEDINPETTTTAAETNLLPNGSFEDNTATAPDNWTVTDWNVGANIVDSTTQNHGKYSMKFVSTGSGGGYAINNALLPIIPSTKYSLGFSIKSTDAGVRNVIELLWYKADGTASATVSTSLYDNSTTNPTSWTENWYETTSPSDAFYTKVKVTGCHSSDVTAGTTYFDGIVLTDSAHKRANQTLSGTLTMSGKSVIEANASIAAHATTMDPWSSGNYVTATGTAVTFTDLANAPQAGAEAEIYMNAAHIWTDNANLEVDGDANWTAEAGDRVLIRAKAVAGPFTIQPIKKTGKPIAGTTISGTAQATTSGTEWEYTSIPSWVTEIQCSVYGFSTNGSSLPIIQIGDSGGYEITGYSGSSGNYAGTASTSLYAGSGFELSPSVAAGEGRTGTITLTLADAASNTWVANGNLGRTDAGSISVTGGSKALSGVLDRVRLTMTNGTDVGDAGAFNILYK